MTRHTVLDELEARGLIKDCTDRDGLAARLAEGPIRLYFGCDPTADSLHVGNLIGLLVLRRFQDAGHRVVALVGGATGMVGDPSGRSEERNLLDDDTLAGNVAAIRAQIERIVPLQEPDGVLVDNRDWTGPITFLEFLRDVGKHVTVNTMLARDSVKARLDSEHGISFTEFSYMLLQAHDFMRLEDLEDVQLQIGGSDQWGNMVGGVDLIRRVSARPAWALCWPLLTAPDGTKLGKSTGARIWLDPERTSPYRLYQHWMATDDRQVRQFLLWFTLLPVDVVDRAMSEHEADPSRRVAQKLLAEEATRLIHGDAEAEAAAGASEVLFSGSPESATAEVLAAVAAEVPARGIRRKELAAGASVVDLLSGEELLTGSKGEARRAIEQGGVYLNGARVSDAAAVATEADLLADRYLLLRRGKRSYGLIEVTA